MITKFPDSGDFSQFILHEVILHLVESRFSGSLDLQYEEYGRTLRFDNGNPCAASSAAAEEQIDNIIKAEQEPLLTPEQKEEMDKDLAKGQKYGKAAVDAGVISSADLLDYNRTQAKSIFAGALQEHPDSYTISEGQPSKHNPLSLNLLEIIRQSILNDLDDELVESKLDDESISYRPDDDAQYSGHEALKEDEEIKSILSHLKGGKPATEVVSKVGLNPERTKRNFLFLKLMGWIKTTEELNFPETEDPFQPEDEFSSEEVSGETADSDKDSDDILKLLGEDETELYDVDATSPEMPALADPTVEKKDDEEADDFMAPGPVEKAEEEESFASQLIRKTKRRTPLIIIIPAIAIVVLILVTAGIMLWPQVTGQSKEKGISFYDEKLDKEQLPLDQDFREKKEAKPERVEIKVPVEERIIPVEDEKVQTVIQEQKDEPEQKEEIEAAPVEQIKEEQKPETKPVSEEPPANNYTWEEAQPLALDKGFRENWKRAWEIWSGPFSRSNASSYTIYITSTGKNEHVTSVFEEFANSARLRDRFFVICTDENKYFIYWGIFSSATSAEVAKANFPPRIKKFRPQIKKIAGIK